MISQKTLKIAMGIGMVLCASASFAARTESIEAALSDTIWYGDINGARVEGAPTQLAVDYPIADTNHTYVLNVEGSVICSNTTSTATASVSDFLVYIPELSDELETDGLGDAKIAVAAGTNLTTSGKIPLMLYCKAGNAEAADWLEIAEVDSSTWHRVTLVFKDSRCRVSLDGQPVKKTGGYKESSGTDTGTDGGAWYNLAGSGNAVRSLSFIGCAKLDDVVIKDEFNDDAFTTTAVATLDSTVTGGETVSYNNLNKWGMTSDELVAQWESVLNQTSGMTVAQKLECGLDPTTDTKFEPVSITKTSADEATITFPCDDSTKMGRYKIVITGGTCNNGSVVTGATTEGCEAGRAKITLSNLNQTAPVMTFKLVAEK